MLHVTGITGLHLHFSPCFPSAACNNRKHHGAIRGLLTFCRYVWNKVSVLPGLFLHRPSFLRLCDTDVSVGGLNSPLHEENSSFSPAPGFYRLPFEVRWGMAGAHMHSVPPHRRHETSDSPLWLRPPQENVKTIKKKSFLFFIVAIVILIVTLKLFNYNVSLPVCRFFSLMWLSCIQELNTLCFLATENAVALECMLALQLGSSSVWVMKRLNMCKYLSP